MLNKYVETAWLNFFLCIDSKKSIDITEYIKCYKQ